MNSRSVLKRLFSPVLIPLANWYLAYERWHRYRDIKVKVKPGVFHPGLFISTKILLDFLAKQDLVGKTFLELGAGTGIISIASARKGAEVHATDIDPTAVENINENARLNDVEIQVHQSDLFDQIPDSGPFHWIVINPPYYPSDPEQMNNYAMYCGSGFEYFQKLFKQLGNHEYENNRVIMILSEDCRIKEIKAIGLKHGWTLEVIEQRKRFGEWNYVFRILRC